MKALEDAHPQDSDNDDEEDWTPDPIDADPSKHTPPSFCIPITPCLIPI